jgi:hypothetical protein
VGRLDSLPQPRCIQWAKQELHFPEFPSLHRFELIWALDMVEDLSESSRCSWLQCVVWLKPTLVKSTPRPTWNRSSGQKPRLVWSTHSLLSDSLCGPCPKPLYFPLSNSSWGDPWSTLLLICQCLTFSWTGVGRQPGVGTSQAAFVWSGLFGDSSGWRTRTFANHCLSGSIFRRWGERTFIVLGPRTS